MSDDVVIGRLLVAAPVLRDGNFDRSVVLVLDHSAEGALGVILNRPSTTNLRDALPQWGDRAAEPSVVFVGGPVNPSAAICIAGSDATSTEGWQRLFGRIGTLDLGRDPADLAISVDWLRVFAGYAGWSAGQLDDEIAAGAWWVVDAEPTDVLSPEPARLWRDVLRRQRGPLAAVADVPADPSVN
ncbi:MAG: YqgE/AlgH family protein [Acidimicrobiales bacterium]